MHNPARNTAVIKSIIPNRNYRNWAMTTVVLYSTPGGLRTCQWDRSLHLESPLRLIASRLRTVPCPPAVSTSGSWLPTPHLHWHANHDPRPLHALESASAACFCTHKEMPSAAQPPSTPKQIIDYLFRSPGLPKGLCKGKAARSRGGKCSVQLAREIRSPISSADFVGYSVVQGSAGLTFTGELCP